MNLLQRVDHSWCQQKKEDAVCPNPNGSATGSEIYSCLMLFRAKSVLSDAGWKFHLVLWIIWIWNVSQTKKIRIWKLQTDRYKYIEYQHWSGLLVKCSTWKFMCKISHWIFWNVFSWLGQPQGKNQCSMHFFILQSDSLWVGRSKESNLDCRST